MEISLVKAKDNDAQAILDMQVAAFKPLLEKYKDDEINPANESIEKVLKRINRKDGSFFKILAGNKLVGAICISWRRNTILD